MKYPKNYKSLTKEDQEEWDYINKCIQNLSKNYKVRSATNPSIFDFQLINSKRNPKYFNSWRILEDNLQFKLCLIEYEIQWQEAHSYRGRTVSDSHKYFFGHLSISKDYGITLIRPETIADKVSEIFSPIEIDLPNHKKFNRLFYLLSNDKNKITNTIDEKLIDYLCSKPKLQLEFNHNRCLFRLPKAVDLDQTKSLCNIGLNLDKILNSKTTP